VQWQFKSSDAGQLGVYVHSATS